MSVEATLIGYLPTLNMYKYLDKVYTYLYRACNRLANRLAQNEVYKSLKAYPHYKPDSIPIESESIETGSKLDSIRIDRVCTIVRVAAPSS